MGKQRAGLVAALLGLLVLAAAVLLPIGSNGSDVRPSARAALRPASATDAPALPAQATSVAPAPWRWQATTLKGADAALPQLAFEAPLVPAGQLSYDQALLALRNEHFDRYMQTVIEQSQRDADAASVTALYAQNLQQALQNAPDVSLQQFACGLRICVGSLGKRDNGADNGAGRLLQHALRLEGVTPAYSMIELPVESHGEHRFMFSLDEGVTGIEGPSLP
ncbi:hypothetical protein [Stenotrophomonas sp. ZAC14D2_NAIMI4_7]|uniref:hypothetical protein n=1 Tax=Stenotrophomonas sp. ZAC14D2_NAIMI4_7 TaxID=2072405 RepID=UPI00131EDEEE|nr:hypothetical protein [Stenotrophomonas sp. ZAC14D2_NAIMI4_7]